MWYTEIVQFSVHPLFFLMKHVTIVWCSYYTRPCYAKLSYRSVDTQTLHGNVHQVDHVPNGPTNSAAITTMFLLRLCGGKLVVAVT